MRTLYRVMSLVYFLPVAATFLSQAPPSLWPKESKPTRLPSKNVQFEVAAAGHLFRPSSPQES